MITCNYLPLLELIIKIKNKKLKKQILNEFGKDKLFRKCLKEIITNLVRRKNELKNKNKLSKFNTKIATLMKKKGRKDVKAKAISGLDVFLDQVIPSVKLMLEE